MVTDIEAAAEFLEFDLRDTADLFRERVETCKDTDWSDAHEAAAKLCEQLADAVNEIEPSLLRAYAAARNIESEELRGDDASTIHCSMTMELGFLLEPKTIEDLCRMYIHAIEWIRHDPCWADPNADMYKFWIEFTRAGHG
jgi:hypothetical protein